MSERIEEIRESYKCIDAFEKEAGKREFSYEELKKVVSSQKVINDSIPYLLKELETKDFTIRSLEHNRELLSKELEEAQQTITRQLETLEFYASRYNHEVKMEDTNKTRVESDGGSRARSILRGESK